MKLFSKVQACARSIGGGVATAATGATVFITYHMCDYYVYYINAGGNGGGECLLEPVSVVDDATETLLYVCEGSGKS